MTADRTTAMLIQSFMNLLTDNYHKDHSVMNLNKLLNNILVGH